MSEGFRLTATNLSTNHVDGACANGIGNARSWNLYIEGYASGPANAGRNASTLVQCVDASSRKRRGNARPGAVGHGAAGEAWQGGVWQGSAWQGNAG